MRTTTIFCHRQIIPSLGQSIFYTHTHSLAPRGKLRANSSRFPRAQPTNVHKSSWRVSPSATTKLKQSANALPGLEDNDDGDGDELSWDSMCVGVGY